MNFHHHLKRTWHRVREYFSGDGNGSPRAGAAAQAPPAPQPVIVEPPSMNSRPAAAHAASQIFAPRHAAHEQLFFQQVAQGGSVLLKSEEWHRDGGALRTITRQALVVTCSGAVVAAQQIKGRCATCGGYEATLQRCQACGRVLCHLHAYRFSSPEGAVMLCDQHYRNAVQAFDLWQAWDKSGETRRPS